MYQPPSPTHGYLAVTVVFWGYVLAAGAAALVVSGAVEELPVGVGFVAALLLFFPAVLPLFRRYHPGALSR